MALVRLAHQQLIFGRRVERLARHLAARIPQGSRVLDIGCGSGDVAAAILRLRPDVGIEGIDVLVRPGSAIPVRPYDGETVPFPDGSFDLAMMIDVLHHTDDPAAVMREAARVSTAGILVKDHFRNGIFAGPTLRLMDWVGNKPHGVRLPYNYLSRHEWSRIWAANGLRTQRLLERLDLYPFPLNLLFERKLHFIARLVPD